MPLGGYMGAGGVKSLYRCYVGAGGVKSVSGIYIGQGGAVRRVWPSGLIYSSGVVYQPMNYEDNTSSSYSSITYGSSALTISNASSSATASQHTGWLFTDDTFDMSQYSTLSVNFNVIDTRTSGNSFELYLGVGSSTKNTNSFEARYYETNIYTTGTRTVTLDLSSVTGAYYFKLAMVFPSNNYDYTVNVTHIELS